MGVKFHLKQMKKKLHWSVIWLKKINNRILTSILITINILSNFFRRNHWIKATKNKQKQIFLRLSTPIIRPSQIICIILQAIHWLRVANNSLAMTTIILMNITKEVKAHKGGHFTMAIGEATFLCYRSQWFKNSKMMNLIGMNRLRCLLLRNKRKMKKIGIEYYWIFLFIN
jgi:hypothetical protein